MISFPKSTEYGKVLHKTKLFEQTEIRGKIKQSLIDDIMKITISNKLAQNTLNIDAGRIFSEILILKVALKKRTIDIKLLDAIDRSIRSSFIVFILEYNDNRKISIAYKENTTRKMKIIKRWSTEWVSDINLELVGSNIDLIYENFINQVSGGKIPENNNSLKEKVEYIINIAKIEKQIELLTSKINNEPQFKKQLIIKDKIKNLKEQLCQTK